jgi:PKD domain
MRLFCSVLCVLSCLQGFSQSLSVSPDSAPEGSTITVRYVEAGDPGPLSRLDAFSFNFGDGATTNYSGVQSSFNITHRYLDNRPGGGPYVVQVYEENVEGEIYESFASMNIINIGPSFSLPGSFSLNMGQTLQYSGSFTDPGADNCTATIDYGDGSPATLLSLGMSRSFTLNHDYLNGGNHTLSVTIRDDDGAQETRTSIVNVQPSQPPELSIYTFAGLVITGHSGVRYDIQKADSLQATNWITITNLVLTNNSQLWIDLSSTNSANRFYRAVQAGGGN